MRRDNRGKRAKRDNRGKMDPVVSTSQTNTIQALHTHGQCGETSGTASFWRILSASARLAPLLLSPLMASAVRTNPGPDLDQGVHNRPVVRAPAAPYAARRAGEGGIAPQAARPARGHPAILGSPCVHHVAASRIGRSIVTYALQLAASSSTCRGLPRNIVHLTVADLTVVLLYSLRCS